MTSLHPHTSVIVPTTAGHVSGIDHPHGTAFLSVPFAAPPTGERRFLAPQAPEPWQGVRACEAYGPTPQRRPFGPTTTIPEPSIPGDDTLSLSVFTPAAGDVDAGLPVFVWIHGGGYFAGSPASPWYDGRSFARDGVVTVVVSYRLGFDGFGWIDGAPHNRGVLDQIEALRWVRDNIRAFGGDPSRVTIGGQSAGGGSVLTLLTSPAAVGLFSAAISHSGAPSALPLETAETVARRFADSLGIEPTLDGWRTVSEMRIIESQNAFNAVPGVPGMGADAASIITAVRADPGASLSLAFAPVVDEVTVLAAADGIARGFGAAVPLLLGATRNEFAWASPDQDGAVALDALLRGAGLTAEAIGAFHREVDRLGPQYGSSQLLVAQMFRVPAAQIAAERAAAGGAATTWMFDFAHPSAVDGLAGHCHDVPFAWDVLAADGVETVLGHAPQALADEMHGEWVRFITGGEVSWSPVADLPDGARVFGGARADEPTAYLFERELIG